MSDEGKDLDQVTLGQLADWLSRKFKGIVPDMKTIMLLAALGATNADRIPAVRDWIPPAIARGIGLVEVVDGDERDVLDADEAMPKEQVGIAIRNAIEAASESCREESARECDGRVNDALVDGARRCFEAMATSETGLTSTEEVYPCD